MSINYGHPSQGTPERPNHIPGVLPRFYGKPIDCPTGHKWSGYAEDAPEARAVPSSAGNPVDVERVTAALVAATDGATVGQRGEPYTGDGILVALPEHAETVNASRDVFTVELVRRWIARVAPVVSATGAVPARYFGAWLDGGTLYLDVVEAFSSADEDAAIAAGRARNQIAVWHNGRQEEIPTGGTGHVQVVDVFDPISGQTTRQHVDQGY